VSSSNAIRNISSGLLFKISNIPIQLVIRFLIINYLGIEYLGLNTFFLAIVNILNLAELGFGAAIVYTLYEPISKNDQIRIAKILAAYRLIYRYIGFFVLLASLLLMPLLHLIIGETSISFNDIYLCYLLYIFSILVNFWVVPHKIAILNSHMRRDVITNSYFLISVIISVLQVYILLFFENYILFVVLFLLKSILQRILASIWCNRIFPDIFLEKGISKDYFDSTWRKVKALVGHKIGDAVIISTDTLIISYFLGLGILAIYSNYSYLLVSVFTLIDVLGISIVAIIGNAINLKNKTQITNLFTRINRTYLFLLSFATFLLVALYDNFIEIWLGADYLINSQTTVTLLCAYFFVSKSRLMLLSYHDASGLWDKSFFKPYVAAFTNILLSLLLVNSLGINGVIISSILVMLCINLPWEIFIVKQNVIEDSDNLVEKDLLEFFVITIIFSMITHFICQTIVVEMLYMKFLLSLGVALAVMLLMIILFSIRYGFIENIRSWISSNSSKKSKI
jgi:O-antigen/teichoic acid export membrane protein